VNTFELNEYNLIIFLTKPKLALADKIAVLNGLGEVAMCRTAQLNVASKDTASYLQEASEMEGKMRIISPCH